MIKNRHRRQRLAAILLLGTLTFAFCSCGEAAESAGEHEHQWEMYDCTHDKCKICGKIRHN